MFKVCSYCFQSCDLHVPVLCGLFDLPGVLKKEYSVSTGSPISEVAFHPSDTHKGYNLYLSSRTKGVVYFMDLATGKLMNVEGKLYSKHTITKAQTYNQKVHYISNNLYLKNFISAGCKSILSWSQIVFHNFGGIG